MRPQLKTCVQSGDLDFKKGLGSLDRVQKKKKMGKFLESMTIQNEWKNLVCLVKMTENGKKGPEIYRILLQRKGPVTRWLELVLGLNYTKKDLAMRK